MNDLFELFEDEAKRRALRYVAANRNLGFYRHDFVEDAIMSAWVVYLPYPALHVKPNWWETADGQAFATVEWTLYSREAITQSQAAKLLHVSAAMVWKLSQKQTDLRVYRKPNFTLIGHRDNPRTGQPMRPYYMRRSQVIDYQEKKAYGKRTKSSS